MLLTQVETEELARRILALSDAEGCTVGLDGHESDNFRFASRGGATNGTTAGGRLTVTSSFGQRQGRATTNLFDERALRDVVARSEAAAHSAPDNIEVMPPLGPQNYGTSAAYFETAAKSFSTSYGSFEYMYGFTARLPTWPMISVCPSGSARATSCIATLPPPPGLFSTTIGCPRLFSISAASVRATIDELPPGANGTTRRIGFVGQVCACAQTESSASAATSDRSIFLPPAI